MENEIAKIIAIESGKPIKYARSETKRASFTIKSSGEEAKKIIVKLFHLMLNLEEKE
jgi:acyl-CoA reductase-like NAD-dependent aldehyde dehydrogenase